MQPHSTAKTQNTSSWKTQTGRTGSISKAQRTRRLQPRQKLSTVTSPTAQRWPPHLQSSCCTMLRQNLEQFRLMIYCSQDAFASFTGSSHVSCQTWSCAVTVATKCRWPHRQKVEKQSCCFSAPCCKIIFHKYYTNCCSTSAVELQPWPAKIFLSIHISCSDANGSRLFFRAWYIFRCLKAERCWCVDVWWEAGRGSCCSSPREEGYSKRPSGEGPFRRSLSQSEWGGFRILLGRCAWCPAIVAEISGSVALGPRYTCHVLFLQVLHVRKTADVIQPTIPFPAQVLWHVINAAVCHQNKM